MQRYMECTHCFGYGKIPIDMPNYAIAHRILQLYRDVQAKTGEYPTFQTSYIQKKLHLSGSQAHDILEAMVLYGWLRMDIGTPEGGRPPHLYSVAQMPTRHPLAEEFLRIRNDLS